MPQYIHNSRKSKLYPSDLLELGQTLFTAKFVAALLHLERERCFTVCAAVRTDGDVVHAAEPQKTRLTADLVDGVLFRDLVFALQEDKQRSGSFSTHESS